MTTTDAARTVTNFAKLSDLILNGDIGDTATESGDRHVATYTLTDVCDGEDSHVDRTVLVDELTTRHYGRPEYVGRPGYVFRSVLTQSQRVGASRKEGYTVVSRVVDMSARMHLIAQEDAKRFSAKRLQEVHARAAAVQ